MIPVEEAYEILMSNLCKSKTEPVDIRKSVGRILTESIYADRNFPPFDRVTMDGIAIRFEDWQQGIREFKVQEMQVAGNPPVTLRKSGNCIEVMTGAMMPEGADTIVRYEDFEIEKKVAVVKELKLKKGANVHDEGSDRAIGDQLLEPGGIIGPAEAAVIATVGESIVQVAEPPKVAILTTGDELVDIDEEPLPHQIRKSNSFAIDGALKELGVTSTILHLNDEKEVMKSTIEEVLDKHEVLILSGGVSKGKKDFVPEVLEELGVEKLFHRVKQRPGKPFWFGVRQTEEGTNYVFALPGNPVSTFLCYYRYVKPWLFRSMGGNLTNEIATLDGDFKFEPDLTYFLQVKLSNEGVLKAAPIAGGGSGDLANLVECDAFMELPATKKAFNKGETFPIYRYR